MVPMYTDIKIAQYKLIPFIYSYNTIYSLRVFHILGRDRFVWFNFMSIFVSTFNKKYRSDHVDTEAKTNFCFRFPDRFFSGEQTIFF